MAQMNKIRQELHSYSSNGSITIVTGSRTGASRYVMLIVVVVAGYGYFWWKKKRTRSLMSCFICPVHVTKQFIFSSTGSLKLNQPYTLEMSITNHVSVKGWKLPDMMFATRCSLGDAGKSFSKQIDGVFSSISVTKRQLSSNLDGVDRNLAESIETTASIQTEVVELRGKTESICTVFKKVQDEVLTLETKINRLDINQDPINGGVFKLCDFAQKLQNSRTTERIQASSSNSSRQCLELPPASPSSMVTPPKSSKPAPELSPASPSRENNGISEVFGVSALESTSNGASGSGRFGFKYPTSSTSTILRT